MALSGSQPPKSIFARPQPWFDVADTLGKEKSLAPIDLGGRFLNEPIPLAMRPPGVLFLDAQDPDDVADMAVFPVTATRAFNSDKTSIRSVLIRRARLFA